jgi:transcriptional regulator with XRE-family HTH domain
MSMLSERLIQLKKEKKLFQKDITEAIGVSARGYQRYEKGEREPTASVLVKLADFFDVSIDYLMGRTEKREVNK